MRKDIIFLLIVVIAICFVCGCASQSQLSTQNNVVTPTPITKTAIPTTVIPTTSMTPEITDIQNITLNETVTSVSIIPTISAKADPTDVSQITFSHYDNGWYSFDYPHEWNLTEYDYTYFDYHNLLRFGKNTTVTSLDGNLSFTVDGVKFEGNDMYAWEINQDIAWCKNYLDNKYPGIGASSYLSDYHYSFTNKDNGAAIFNVVFPDILNITPSAFTEKVVVTNKYNTFFGFYSNNKNFEKYHSLKDYIIGTTNVGA